MLRLVVALVLTAGLLGQQGQEVSTRELAPPDGMASGSRPADGLDAGADDTKVAPEQKQAQGTSPAPVTAKEPETRDEQEVARPSSQQRWTSGRSVAAFWFVSTAD